MIIFSLNTASGVNIQQALEHTYNTSTQFKEKQEEIKGQHEAIVQALSGWRPKINISGGMSLGKQINSGTSKMILGMELLQIPVIMFVMVKLKFVKIYLPGRYSCPDQ